ncbi:MAG TPA: hypothetical protein DCZ95_13960 [Verrucomicrobia bacterium]|nr:hypothetical protein [Verrucomicrobiota bacterium]
MVRISSGSSRQLITDHCLLITSFFLLFSLSASAQLIQSNRWIEGVSDVQGSDVLRATGQVEVVEAAVEIGRSTQLETPAAEADACLRRIQKVTTVFLSDGSRQQTVLSHYTELGGGLHYKGDSGKWQTSVVEAEATPGGGLRFDKLPVKYDFAPSAHQRTVLTERHAGGTARSAVAGMSYYDAKSGQSVVFAWAKNAKAQAIPGGVVYPDAFKGVDGDVIFKLHIYGIEQDIAIYGDLPRPSDLGLDNDSSVLCVLTELLDLEGFSVERPASVRAWESSPEPVRIFQDRGSCLYNLQRCYAYAEDTESLTLGGAGRTAEQLVSMRVFSAEGRTFLSEEIPVASLWKNFQYLFVSKPPSRLPTVNVPPLRPDLFAGRDGAPSPSEEALSGVSALPTRLGQNGSPLASLRRRNAGSRYVIDYINYSSTQTNSVTFRSNITHFVSAPITFDGSNAVLTVEPGCFVKFAPSAQISFINGARLVSKCNAMTPALFTSVYDTNRAGEVIGGYTGNPNTNRYPAALVFQTGSNSVEGIHVKYAQKGIVFASTEKAAQTVRHSRFSNCGRAVDAQDGTNEIVLLNCLIRDSAEGVGAQTNRLSVYNTTFENIGRWAIGSTGAIRSVYAANCLFASATNMVFSSNAQCSVVFTHNAFYNSTTSFVGSSSIGVTGQPFQVGAQGSNYLNQGVGLVDVGSASADALSLYHFTTAVDQHKETNSQVDIGFHYAAPGDADNDGLNDFIEDANGNGVADAGECNWSGDDDSDNDGLGDGEETWRYGTDPLRADTDADGSLDGAEVLNGSNPLDVGSFLASISGTLSYAGPQTGPIRIRAYPAVGDESSVLYLPFEPVRTNICYDGSRFGNAVFMNGTVSGEGRIGKGASFNGSSDYMRIPTASRFQLTSFTLSAWIKTANAGSSRRRIVSQQGAGGYWIMALNNNLLDFGMCQVGVEEFVETRGVTLNDNAWHFVAVVRDIAGSKARWYVDGIEIGSRNIFGTGTIAVTNQDVFVGKVYDNPEYFTGLMDEVAVMNRAVASNELLHLFHRGVLTNSVKETVLENPGAYGISNLPSGQSYSLRAYRDSDSNFCQTASEAYGLSNRFVLAASADVDIALIDPDNDGDGFSDADEDVYGSDSLNSNSILCSISGTVSYSGQQTGSIPVEATSSYALQNGLALHYSFNVDSGSNILNQSSSTNNGFVYGPAQFLYGRKKAAFSFDGVNDYLRTPRSSTFQLKDFTLMAWIKSSNFGSSRRRIVSQQGNTGNWILSLLNNQLEMGFWVSGGEGMMGTKGPALNNNAWHLVAVIRDTTNRLARWNIDGIEIGTQAIGSNGTINVTDQDVYFGRVYNAGEFFTGSMDEVMVFNRALASNEIVEILYNGTTTGSACRTSIPAPGAYSISNAPTWRKYSVSAFRDSNANGLSDATEAQGAYPNNPLHLTGSSSGVNVELTDPDTDADGMPDWWELNYGFNPTSSVPNGLVGWWKLDETNGLSAFDSTINTNHGVLNNFSANPAPWVAGLIDKALDFDGTNDYVQLANSAALKPTNVTMSVWIRPDQTYSNRSVTLFTTEQPGATAGYSLRYFSWGALDFLICTDSSLDVYCVTTLQAGATYHVVGTYDGAYQRLYVNGQKVAETARAVTLTHSDSSPRMGASADNPPGYYFDGLLDDARIYNNGLSSQQVSGLYEWGADSDGDGLGNLYEYQLGTNPTNSDTDGDGVSDGLESMRNTNPFDPLSLNITLFTDSLVGLNIYDGYSPSMANGHGPKLNIQSGIMSSISGDVVQSAEGIYTESFFDPESKSLQLLPIGHVEIQ